MMGLLTLLSLAPLDRAISRYVTRTENTGERLAATLGTALTTWIYVGGLVLAFLFIVSIAAVADWHMLTLLRRGLGEFGLYVFRGMRMFFRVVRDRYTPNFARLILLSALAYWLSPIDFVPDDTIIPGFIDDFFIAIVSAKLFVRFCPDGVIAKHAMQVQDAVGSS